MLLLFLFHGFEIQLNVDNISTAPTLSLEISMSEGFHYFLNLYKIEDNWSTILNIGNWIVIKMLILLGVKLWEGNSYWNNILEGIIDIPLCGCSLYTYFTLTIFWTKNNVTIYMQEKNTSFHMHLKLITFFNTNASCTCNK